MVDTAPTPDPKDSGSAKTPPASSPTTGAAPVRTSPSSSAAQTTTSNVAASVPGARAPRVVSAEDGDTFPSGGQEDTPARTRVRTTAQDEIQIGLGGGLAVAEEAVRISRDAQAEGLSVDQVHGRLVAFRQRIRDLIIQENGEAGSALVQRHIERGAPNEPLAFIPDRTTANANASVSNEPTLHNGPDPDRPLTSDPFRDALPLGEEGEDVLLDPSFTGPDSNPPAIAPTATVTDEAGRVTAVPNVAPATGGVAAAGARSPLTGPATGAP